MPLSELSIPGAHNVSNALAAVAVALLFGLPAETIRRAAGAFAGVEHRLEECGQPFMVEGATCMVGVSMGIAGFPDDGSSMERVVSAADAAMYRVKRDKKNGYAFAGEIERAEP